MAQPAPESAFDAPSRALLARALTWRAAHVALVDVLDGWPPDRRGVRAPGLPHSGWELAEHVRRAGADILAFCRDARYEQPAWPDDYWPASPAPPDDAAWDACRRGIAADREALAALVRSAALGEPLPNGDGQTLLREALLLADHDAYHTGQLVAVRQALGLWPPPGGAPLGDA